MKAVLNISSGSGRKKKVAMNMKEKAGLDIRMTWESANQAALVQDVVKKLPVCQNPIKPIVR